MRAPLHAPAVRYPCGRSPAVGWALAIVAATALAGMAAWLELGTADADMAVKAAAGQGLWLSCTAAAWLWWRRMPMGHLAWDGGQWLLDCGAPGPDPVQGKPHVHLDLQGCLLLSVRLLRGRPSWLWLERRSDPVQWAALRRAVYSPARSKAPDPAEATDAAPPALDGGMTTKT